MIDTESFKKRIKTTAYAKFDSHKRYERLNNTSLFALTSASSLLIFVSIFNKFMGDLRIFNHPSLVELFSIVVSIIMLILSLVVSFASYSLRSERSLRCGNEMIDLHDRLELCGPDVQKIESVVNEYIVLRKSADNHKRFHYTRGRLERKSENDKNKLVPSDYPTIFEKIEYWAPILMYYLVSSFSIAIFLTMSMLCIYYA